ncbi:hypothetical protein D9M68_1010730 [compost metagenome]
MRWASPSTPTSLRMMSWMDLMMGVRLDMERGIKKETRRGAARRGAHGDQEYEYQTATIRWRAA